MQRLAGRSVWTLSSTLVVTLALFTETIVLARHFGPHVYGTFLLVIAIPEAVLQVLDLRVKDALTKYLSEALETDRPREAVALLKLFWMLDVAVGLFCLALVFALAGVAANLLVGAEGSAHLMRIYAIGLLFGTLDTASGTVLRVMDRFRLAFVVNSLGFVARVGLVVGAVVLDGSLNGVVWARAGGELGLTLLLGGASLAILKPMLWPHRATPTSAIGERRREILGFLMSTNLTGTLKMASTKLDTILIGALASPVVVAHYRFALQFARAPVQLSDALYTVVFPTIARAHAGGRPDEIRRLAVGSTRLLAMTVVPVCVVAAFFGGDLLTLFGGREYAEGGVIFALGLISVLPYVVCFWLKPVLLTSGHAKTILRIQAIATVVQVAGIVALVPVIEGEGAAVALAVSNVLAIVMQLRFLRGRRLLSATPATPAAAAHG
jgi:O-antigen/teichoic acid export membrane protein